MSYRSEKRHAMALTSVVGLLAVALLQCHIGNAYIYDVGDDRGWTFDVSNWTNGKTFKAGDQLQFNYLKEEHNVVTVEKELFDKCSKMYPVYDSGKDVVVLDKGYNYFVSSAPNDCRNGMKLAVYAA